MMEEEILNENRELVGTIQTKNQGLTSAGLQRQQRDASIDELAREVFGDEVNLGAAQQPTG